MLTARDSLDNKLAGFDSGADDYLIKPFALQEVEVRLNALSRRGKGVHTRVLETGDLEYNLDTLEVRRRGKLLQLNPTALKILQALMEASRPWSRARSWKPASGAKNCRIRTRCACISTGCAPWSTSPSTWQ